MGFFDKLAKSFLGIKARDVVRPLETIPDPGSDPRAKLTLDRVVVPATNSRVVSEPSVSLATAVALAEPPAMAKPPEDILTLDAAPIGRDLFDDGFDQELDDAFDSIVTHTPPTVAATPTQNLPAEAATANAEWTRAEQAVVENLFAEIAANYALPVKNFILELKRGTATKEWLEICHPVLQSIRRSAEGMGLNHAVQQIIAVEAVLSEAQTGERRLLSGEMRDLLLSSFEKLTRVMPQAFAIKDEQQRESIIIHALLTQIPKLGPVTIQKLYRAGLTSIDSLSLATKEDLAAATGIPVATGERICERFRSYLAEPESGLRPPDAASQRRRLSQMLAELRNLNERFQIASKNERSNRAFAAEKREFRQQRQHCWLGMNVLLAEMGEVNLLIKLKKLSFDRRLQRLQQFISSPYTAA